MLFAHLYLIQEEKVEAWFVSPASREYFGVESTAFVSGCCSGNPQKFQVNIKMRSVFPDYLFVSYDYG